MKKLWILSIAFFSLASCTKDFENINENPNNPARVEPDFLFTNAILQTMNLYGGDMNRIIFFNYTHHFSGFQGEFQRYTHSPASTNQYWRETYINCLQPLRQIELSNLDDPQYKNRVTIAKIWQNFIYSNTVAIWGGVPRGAALTGEPAIAYETEQNIYEALLRELKEQANAIDLAGDKYSVNADKIYGGDLLKWKKFANTLRLRIAMRISAADPEAARAVVAEIFADQANTISAKAETAAAKWGLTSDVWNPLYDRAVYNFNANQATIPVLNESLVYYMSPYNDARLEVYAKPVASGPLAGTYFGQNISYGGGSEFASGDQVNPHTGLKQVNYSQIGDWFTRPDAEYIFLSYAESNFLKAEAALKGWWGTEADAESFYYEGINASFKHYGISGDKISAYKNTPGVKWGTASDTTGREAAFQDWLRICTSYIGEGEFFKQIVMQHWLAIPMQGVDAWTLIRRTRTLDFQPQFATYDGDYKYVPQRIPYAGDEYQTNKAEVDKAVSSLNGPDDLFTKLWFALPVVKNPYLPY